jgi:hypothetical protein
MRKSILALAVGVLLGGSVFAAVPASAETTVVTKSTPDRVLVVKKHKPMMKKVVIHKSAKSKKVIKVRADGTRIIKHSPRGQVAVIKRD